MSLVPLSASSDIEDARSNLDESKQEQVGEPTNPNHPEPKPKDQAENNVGHPEDLKKVHVEKVIVLSFRALQLQRIAELQD